MRTYSAASSLDSTRADGKTTVHITEVTRRAGGLVDVVTMCGQRAGHHGQVGWNSGRSLFVLGLPDSFFHKCGRCARTRGTNVERYEMTRESQRFGNLPSLVTPRTPDTMTVVQDDTGDTLVEWHGCIVGARFTTGRDATAFLDTRRTMEDRPERCTRPSGGYGGCVRQAGHPAQCADAHGYRFTFPTEDEKRAASMAAHPAGKGRKAGTARGIRTGDTVEIASRGMRDNGRRGTVVAVNDAETVSVRLDGDAHGWSWHRSQLVPVHGMPGVTYVSGMPVTRSRSLSY